MTRVKLLITGSNGRIGKVLIRGLADSFEIYGIDVAPQSGERLFTADISEYEDLNAILGKIGRIDCVVHLAGNPRVKADWASVLRNNIIGTRNVYEAAREHKIQRVIFASSIHVTGAYEGIPPSLHKQPFPKRISIHDPIRPDSDYGTSKAFGESLARQYYELFGIESICLRIGTVLGDDKPPKDERNRRTWLSHRDLIQLVRKSILSDVKFGVYYGISNNKGRFWDISNAEKEIGYFPQDNAAKSKKH